MQTEATTVSATHEVTESTSAVWPPKLPRVVLGAIVAAGVACLILSFLYPIFTVPEEIAIIPDPPPTAAVLKLEKAQFAVDAKNFSIVFGTIAAVLGAAIVLFAFGFRSIKAVFLGAIAAASLGVVGVNLSNWMFTNLRSTSNSDMLLMGITIDSMTQTIIGYAALWGLVGLGAGIGVGSVRGVGKAISAGVAGLLGGTLAAMVYVLLVAQFTPNTTMSFVFPQDLVSQAIWFLLSMILIAAAIALGSGEKRARIAK